MIQALLSTALSSGIIIGILVFVVKKYLEKYITFQFDRRLSVQKTQDQIVAEVKKEFLMKSMKVYEETSKLSYQCLLAGRSMLEAITNDGKVDLVKNWETFNNLQNYLENQAYIDALDYHLIHSYKNNIKQFCIMCQLYVQTSINNHNDRKIEKQYFRNFWLNVVEESFKKLQNSFRIFSIKKDAEIESEN